MDMVTYKKMYDVICIGMLINYNGYIFVDEYKKLHLIHAENMEDFAVNGDIGAIYYKLNSSGGSQVFRFE